MTESLLEFLWIILTGIFAMVLSAIVGSPFLFLMYCLSAEKGDDKLKERLR